MAVEMLSQMAEYNLNGQTVNTTVTTPEYALASAGITNRPHVFIGVTFTDSNGNPTTPGAGTYTVTAETVNNPGTFQAITNGSSIDATATATTLSVASNILRVRVLSESITTATLLNIKVTGNAA